MRIRLHLKTAHRAAAVSENSLPLLSIRKARFCGLYAPHPKAASFHAFAIGRKKRQACPLCRRGRLKTWKRIFRRPLCIESGVQAKVEPNKKPTVRFAADGRFFIAMPYANSSCFSKLSTRLSSSPKACDRRLRKTISLRDKSAQTNRAAR